MNTCKIAKTGGNGCKVTREDFIELGKKEFIIIPIVKK